MARKQHARDLNEGLYATGILTVKLDDKLYAYVGIKSGKVYTSLSDSPSMALVKLSGYLRHEPTTEGATKFRTQEEVDKLLPKFELHVFSLKDDGRSGRN